MENGHNNDRLTGGPRGQVAYRWGWPHLAASRPPLRCGVLLISYTMSLLRRTQTKWPHLAQIQNIIYTKIVTVVLSRDPINLLDWMIRQMLGCKQNVNAPLILQPYVMELVHHNVKNFTGSYEISHQVYWPFIDNEAYLARESSSMACRVSRTNSPSMFLGFSCSSLPILIWDFFYL